MHHYRSRRAAQVVWECLCGQGAIYAWARCRGRTHSRNAQAPGVVCPIRKLESLSKPQAALVSRGVRVRKSILRLACQGTKNWVNGILRQRMCRQGHGPFGEFGPFGLGRLFGAARMGSLVGAFDWGCFDYSGDMGWGPQRPSRSAVVDGPCGTAHVIARAGLEAN